MTLVPQLVDCHTHTSYSDGHGTILGNVASAEELRISTIACTDHFVLPPSIDPACEVSVAASDVEAYAADIARAQEEHPDVEVVFGWECDYYEGCEEYIARYRGQATFLLGSVHALDGFWIDDLSDLTYWQAHPLDYVWKRYFDVWSDACHSPARFSSMAHPDLVSLLGRYPCDAALVGRLYDQAALAAHDAGVHIELNSAGKRKPVGRFYPAPELLVRFFAAGVPITVGSDAHETRHVGCDILELYRLAASAGYRSVDVPRSDGGWRTIEF